MPQSSKIGLIRNGRAGPPAWLLLVMMVSVHARPPTSMVLLMADDAGAGDPGVAGGRALTPQIDAWARSPGTLRLRRMYAMNVCSPSRGALLTGRHSNRLCIWSADTNALPRAETTIAEAAKAAGLATFHAGKWHVGAMSARVMNVGLDGCNQSKSKNLPGHERYWPRDCRDCAPGTSCVVSGPLQNGFDDFYTAQPPAFHLNPNCGCCGGLNRSHGCARSPNMTAYPPGFPLFPQTNTTCPVHDASDASRSPNVSELGKHFPASAAGACSTYYFRSNRTADGVDAPDHSLVGTDAALQVAAFETWLTPVAERKQPFLAVLWFHTPHAPYKSTPRWRRLYEGTAGTGLTDDQRDYFADLSAMDDAIGDLRRLLARLDVRENTMLALSLGDNGPEHGTPGSATVNGVTLLGRKRDLGEGGIRQFGLIEWPAVIAENGETDYPVRITDYMPTLLDLHQVGMPASKNWTLDGESLVPMLERQGRMVRHYALGWVTGHFASQQITGLPVSNCDNGTCADWQTRYDHGRITRSARPPVMQMALIDNELKLYANRTIANTSHLADPAGNRTGHPYSCDPPTPSCPKLDFLPWQWHLTNLTADPGERRNLAAAEASIFAQMKQALEAFAASVVLSQGPSENDCAANFGKPPPS